MRAHTRASMRCQNANNLCDRALAAAAAHLQKNCSKTNKQIYIWEKQREENGQNGLTNCSDKNKHVFLHASFNL